MQFTERHLWSGAGGVRKFIVPQRKAVDEGARTIEFVVSTAARDRDGDIVEPGGWKLDGYMKNPVVLWAHDSNQPPVAKALSAEVRDNTLVATAQFADAETYAFADTVFRLYAGGYLSAVSAGFMPSALEPFEADGTRGYRITEQELWEFSAVPIPANPEALVAAKAAGLDVRPARAWLEKALDEGEARPFRDVMSGAYIKLAGTLHPAVQADLAKRNAKAVEAARAKETAMDEDEKPEAKAEDIEPVNPDAGPADDGEKAGAVFTTGEGGDPLHTHEFTLGDTVTTEAGDPPHVHAVTVAEDGVMAVEDAEGHGHEVPAEAKAQPDPTVPDAEDKSAEAEDETDAKEPFAPCPDCANPAVCAAAGACYAGGAKMAKDGRVLSKGNMTRLKEARDGIDEVLRSAEREEVADKAVIKIVETPQPKAVTITPEFVGQIGDLIAKAVETEFRRAAGRVR